MYNKKSFIFLILLLLLTVSCSCRVRAAETPAAVRVGFFDNGDFMHKNNDGTYSGYDMEYYCTLAGYADWNIEVKEYGDLTSALAALRSGDIDIMSGLAKTSERSANYLCSSARMCSTYIAVQTRADDGRFSPEDISSMKDMTCGILKGSNVIKLYQNWCSNNGLIPHVVEFDSLEERNAALISGRVDAIAGGSTVAGAQRVAQFPSIDLYFMFNKDRDDIRVQLDRAMNILLLEDPDFSMRLYEKYFPASRNSSPSFSSSEQAFIKLHPSIKVAVLKDDAPFSSLASDGSVKGILPEYFDHLSSVIGTRFVYIPYASKSSACKALAAGEADMLSKFSDDVYDAADLQLILSNPYIKMNLVRITRAGTASPKTAAVPECNAGAVESTLSSAGSAVIIRSYRNSSLCFDALKAGGTDSVICTQPAATWLLNRNRSSDYVISAFGRDTWNAACALPMGRDGNTLRSILNKSIMADGYYINQLITSYTLDDSANLANIFDRLPVSFITVCLLLLVFLLLIAVAALVVIIRNGRSEKLLHAKQAELASAEEANRIRHNFFGTVSHDMRTPLNGIIGFTDLAMSSNDLPQIRDYLGKIRVSSAILNNLVTDTLIMSRMENGKYTLKPSPNDVREIINDILAPVREMADEKGISFSDNISGLRPCMIMVDRLSFQKILLNLLSNAVKFTPAGGSVTLSCSLEHPEAHEPILTIKISDTGIGIAQDFLPHVFDPYSQENSHNSDLSGSGMGLSIVKSIIDAMNGTIDVTSKKGSGTCFTVILQPQTIQPEADAEETLSEEPPVTIQAVNDRPLAGRHILICEDNEMNMEILKTMLEQNGLEVTGAENGELGVSAFTHHAVGYFDFILMDIRMPVMDGNTAARKIRGLDRKDAASIPIIAVSADAYPENVAECLLAGMNAHISKPVDADSLINTLCQYEGHLAV